MRGKELFGEYQEGKVEVTEIGRVAFDGTKNNTVSVLKCYLKESNKKAFPIKMNELYMLYRPIFYRKLFYFDQINR